MMREEFYVETQKEAFVISVDTINKISEELIAETTTEKDLEKLAVRQYFESEAKKKALLLAFKEYPNPIGNVSLEYRIELTKKRNEYAERSFQEIMLTYNF